jgi:acyl-CoA dehydrogenase
VKAATATDSTLLRHIGEIADAVARPAADSVDREGRFPSEACDALRAVGALSAHVAPSYGGGGASFAEVASACFELSRACAATGMVYAMHQIQVGCIARHGAGTPFFDEYLTALCEEQRLLASATSEIGVGGDLRRSIAAVVPDGDECLLEKKGPTVSYAEHADDYLITARRSADAEASDQVLVLTTRAETTLEQTSSWDALGMRGTCSPGFSVRARFPADHVLPTPFGEIAAQTMVPYSHILWSHVWLGIAVDAYDRARAFVRAQAKGSMDSLPPTATKLSSLATLLHAMRAEIAANTAEYSDLSENGEAADELASIGYAIRINNLKIAASELAPRICADALVICGMAGYKNDTPFSVGRHLRDALSGALMIGNDRIHATNAALLLVQKAG